MKQRQDIYFHFSHIKSNWLFVYFYHVTFAFRGNQHSAVVWMSRNFLLETDAIIWIIFVKYFRVIFSWLMMIYLFPIVFIYKRFTFWYSFWHFSNLFMIHCKYCSVMKTFIIIIFRFSCRFLFFIQSGETMCDSPRFIFILWNL